MFIYKASDKLVFNILKRVKYGYLEITCFDGTLLKFGNIKDNLKANIIRTILLGEEVLDLLNVT